jgi:SsrA-binding protein
MKTLARNKRAYFDYTIEDTLEAGLELLGHEVKSAKQGHISLKGAHVSFHGDEAFLLNAHITPYAYASQLDDYDPYRSRKLLLRASEIRSLLGKKQTQGVSIVALEVYVKHGFVKVKIGVGRGKKKYDKRHSIKQREADRMMRRRMKES